MIIFFSFRKNTASIFRETNVSSGCWNDTEDELCQLFSLLQHWKIVRGVRICTGPMGIQIPKDVRDRLSPYLLWKILLPLHSKHPPDTFLSLWHISIPMNEPSHPQAGDATWYSNPKEVHHSIKNRLEEVKSYDYFQNKKGNVRI